MTGSNGWLTCKPDSPDIFFMSTRHYMQKQFNISPQLPLPHWTSRLSDLSSMHILQVSCAPAWHLRNYITELLMYWPPTNRIHFNLSISHKSMHCVHHSFQGQILSTLPEELSLGVYGLDSDTSASSEPLSKPHKMGLHWLANRRHDRG